jgi:hypothetical protein
MLPDSQPERDSVRRTRRVPRLVRARHQVVNLARGVRAPYVDDEAWAEVEQIQVDRGGRGRGRDVRKAGRWARGRGGGGHDLLHADSAGALVEALGGRSGTWSTAGQSGGTELVSSSRCGWTTPPPARRVRRAEWRRCPAGAPCRSWWPRYVGTASFRSATPLRNCWRHVGSHDRSPARPGPAGTATEDAWRP